jgi:hypothetical protein
MGCGWSTCDYRAKQNVYLSCFVVLLRTCQIKFITDDTVALNPIMLLQIVSDSRYEVTASEIPANFSFKLSVTVPWKHWIVFTRPLRHHAPLQGLNRRQNQMIISTAPCSCRRIQGTGKDKGVVTAYGSRWQHYPCGAVSFCSRLLECVDVLFTQRSPGVLITVLFPAK